MRLSVAVIAGVLVYAVWPAEVVAQRAKRDQEATFVASAPRIGDPLPDVMVYAPDGTAFSTGNLRGRTVVLTFGCLT
jgi:cytochrome oxidase Cu insertion factor (SCO1/SenC/PrrC family)